MTMTSPHSSATQEAFPATGGTRYYPMAYYLDSAWARRGYKEAAAGKVTAGKDPDTLADRLMGLIYQDLSDTPLAGNQPALAMELTEQVKGLLAWIQWAVDGRLIIEASSTLASEMRATDPAELTVADVFDRRETLYIHFGLDRESAPLIDGRFRVEGAYVLVNPSISVRIVLCGRDRNARSRAESLDWHGRVDLLLFPDAYNLPVSEAVERALAHDISDIRDAQAAASPEAAHVVGRNFEQVIERQLFNAPAYKESLALVLNTLAYRKWIEPNITPRWPSSAPISMVRRLNGATPKERARTEDKLWNAGYAPVEFLGDRLEPGPADLADGPVVTSIRKNHWRNQAHGPKMMLRKLIWIRPTIVTRRT